MAMTFARPRLMRWGLGAVGAETWTAITDHNRSPLSIDVERIERESRMANGTLRKYIIADKRTFSCSWTMLPKTTAKTVDGFLGGTGIEAFYAANPGVFTLEITDGDSTVTTFRVVLSEFTKEITKRGSTDMWEISVSMTEV
jgi:hypothetical protein